jgi:mono/diheme cytochrome c family protein
MRTNLVKSFAIVFFVLPFLVLAGFRTAPVIASTNNLDDPAAAYKAKCAACHTPTASKFYDPSHKDEDQVQVILKGKKGEKPPFMPGFEAKGMTAAEAAGLAAYMRTLKPAN